MSALALRERLASLGRAGQTPARPAVQRLLPRGFEEVNTRYGPAWRLLDMVPVGRLRGIPPEVVHAYLDTETTGLSGGTGTQVFAAAVCRPVPAGIELVQLFLADPVGEAAFLHLLHHELQRAGAVATYNGSRFDLPLLRTRWVMTRMPGELAHPGHLDLLTLTRSLLRQRLPTCSLRVVEERVLGLERESDLPGALVPETYFAYLRRGWSPTLEAALAHNRQDVVSLYHLHARLLQRLAGRDPAMEAPDWLALGRHLLRHGRRADGWRALRRAADLGDGPASALAGLLLARTLARRHQPVAADRLLAGLLSRLPAEIPLVIARARLLEWRLGAPGTALEVVEAALAGGAAGGPHLPDLERRHARLAARQDRGSGRRRPRRPPGGQIDLVEEAEEPRDRLGSVRLGVGGRLLESG